MSHSPEQTTVLIVDDMPTNVEVLAGALIKAGYQVAVALDGESAITQIEYKSPALVLLDVMMPGIDGFETCRRLKASPKTQTIPIIFMTALSESVNKSKGFNLGAVDYITKPFDAEEVLARVGTHLQLHELTTALEKTVESRTAELTLALEQLQQTQTQLIQSERMSLVGEISAGIAYEMSNPVNYIRGNLRHLETGLTQLLAFAEDVYPQLQSFQASDSTTSPESRLAEATLDLDLDFAREDLPKILGSFNRGTDKIQQLVSNLRIFADSDKSGAQTADVHELVDSCLSLLGHKLQAKTRRKSIQVNKDYQSIPEITCYPAALSQAVIGILLSYISCLESMKKDQTGDLPQISVQTFCPSDDWVAIKLSIDISEIFSADIIGSSTGSSLHNASTNPEQSLANPDDMNLMLAHGILTHQHQGRLHQQTENGHTCVTLELPVQQAAPVVATEPDSPTSPEGLTNQEKLAAATPASVS